MRTRPDSTAAKSAPTGPRATRRIYVPHTMLTSLAWFLVRSHSALAPPRVLPATRGTCLCRHGMPATDRNGRRRRSTATDRSGGREAIAGYGQRLGPTSPAPAPSALGLFTRPVSTQRIDHYRSWQPRTEFLYPTGLAILEACCFVGAAGGVAGAVRVSAGARERAAIDDQVFLADRTSVEPALEDLAHSGRIAGLRR